MTGLAVIPGRGSALKLPAAPRQLRCAVYTRVSTEHGLDRAFNSLDNQREAATACVESQAGEGWRPVRDRYDDGGFSGGTTDCPALKRLLDDIAARRVDVVVVYKVDRLTGALADFAKLVELFDAQSVSFVSVTQSCNTTASMGRLTLNVRLDARAARTLLSLAFVAPDIVEAAVDGTLPRGFGISRLTDLPPNWHEQRRQLGIGR